METFKKLFFLLFLMQIASGYAQPGVAAPAPPARNAADVVRVYTDSYASSPAIVGPSWANATETTVAGNLTRYANNVTFSQVAFAATNITGMTFVHIDIYTNPGSPTQMRLQVGGSFSGFFATPNGQWTSVDIPMSTYGSPTSVNLVNIQTGTGTPSTNYFDNIYFYKPSAGGNPAPTFGTFTIPNKIVGDADFTIPQPTTDSSGAITYSSGNTGVATIVGGNMLHIVGAGTSTITLNQAADATHAAGSTTATFTVAPASTTPAVGPPTPPVRNAWDVLSQYGSAYTNQSGVSFFDFGGSTIVGDVTLADNSVVKKYINHSYSGISTNGALSLNVSQMTHLHIDVWSPDFVSFKIKLEAVNGSNLELEVPGAKNQGVWNSYDIPLSNYTGVDLTALRYIVPVTFNPNNTTLFISNVYFYRPATALPPPTLGAFTVPAKNLGDPDFTITPPISNSTGAFTYTSSNTSVATIVGGNNIHIVGGGSSTITATQAATSSYGSASTTATFVVSYPAPGPSPVPPARNPADVLSMFTGTPTVYANGVTAVRAPWSNGATTLTEVPNGTNTALQVNNMGYLGYITNGANFSIAGKTKLHVDVYLNTPLTSLFVFLLAPSDNIYVANNLTAGWNSLDIDLSNYGGANLSDIYGLKFESNTSPAPFQMYLDNIYFYVPAGIAPTITDFNVPAAVFGDAPFNLTPPNSNSAGAFTYTSSNTSVATISGNTVTLVGPGSSTITAFQAADGGYEAGSITATLVVANPPLATAAPTPPARNSFDVISLYSNAYAESSAPVWQNAAATTDVLLEGNDTKKISNFLVEFLNFAPTNVTDMTTLHMDVYSDDCTAMNIWLLNNGDRNAQITLLPSQWNSFDIPLSTYANLGLNLNGVSQIKFESLNGPGKTIYVDNIYFYRPATLMPPTLSNFNVPAQAFGAPDFALTPPTSNSTGAFTYTSSNTAVATISGNMVHVVGGGTSTITSTQASNGTFGSASITAQLVVSFPIPGASPIPPARTPDRVVSMYTGTPPVYANAITAVRSNWTGATTLTEVPNGTNTALRLDNFGFLGLVDQAETRFDVSGMSHLNIDIYLNEPLNSNPALSRVFIFLLANGDFLYDSGTLVTGWNSLHIPLSNFAGADLTQIYGLKLEQNTSPLTQIYIDNVYFSNDCYTYYADADSDGYGNPAVSQLSCTGAPAGFVLNNTDCNDAVAAINPGHAEVLYNGVDDNCDGQLDEGNQLTTSLLASSCGTTLASIGSLVGITTVSSAITGYRIKVTNGAQVQIIEKTVPHFTFPQFPSYAYATTYTVEIELQRNGIWLGYYGPACLVSTPAILEEGGATAVSPSQCGITLPKINTLIATTSLQGVTGYRFKVSNLTDPLGPNAVQTIDRTQNWFSLPMLARYNYGTQYRIEIAVKTTGAFGGFGAPCEVSSPPAPSLINCGGTAASGTSTVAATSIQGATQYRFQITRQSDLASATIDRSTNYFIFNSLPAAAFTPGALYGIRVAVMTSGFWSPFGDACEYTAPGGASKGATAEYEPAMTSEFKVSTYPNPFTTDFNINIASSNQAKVLVKVYDMLGQLLVSKEMDAADVNNSKLGTQLPSGVYNVIVSQDGTVKTQRVIKR